MYNWNFNILEITVNQTNHILHDNVWINNTVLLGKQKRWIVKKVRPFQIPYVNPKCFLPFSNVNYKYLNSSKKSEHLVLFDYILIICDRCISCTIPLESLSISLYNDPLITMNNKIYWQFYSLFIEQTTVKSLSSWWKNHTLPQQPGTTMLAGLLRILVEKCNAISQQHMTSMRRRIESWLFCWAQILRHFTWDPPA